MLQWTLLFQIIQHATTVYFGPGVTKLRGDCLGCAGPFATSACKNDILVIKGWLCSVVTFQEFVRCQLKSSCQFCKWYVDGTWDPSGLLQFMRFPHIYYGAILFLGHGHDGCKRNDQLYRYIQFTVGSVFVPRTLPKAY